MATTGLKHIKDNAAHDSTFNQFCNKFSISVLSIEYCVDISVPQITISIFLAGIKIGGGTINTQNPQITIGGSALGFKAEVTLAADFNKKQVTYEIEICAPIVGCKDYKGLLFSW